jgi:hypothetical protein
MCCLKYEEETYEYLSKTVPTAGDWVRTPDGEGEVLSVNVLRQMARVAVQKSKQDETIISNYPADKIKVLAHQTVPRDPSAEPEGCPVRNAANGAAVGCLGCAAEGAHAGCMRIESIQDNDISANEVNKKQANKNEPAKREQAKNTQAKNENPKNERNFNNRNNRRR